MLSLSIKALAVAVISLLLVSGAYAWYKVFILGNYLTNAGILQGGLIALTLPLAIALYVVCFRFIITAKITRATKG